MAAPDQLDKNLWDLSRRAVLTAPKDGPQQRVRRRALTFPGCGRSMCNVGERLSLAESVIDERDDGVRMGTGCWPVNLGRPSWRTSAVPTARHFASIGKLRRVS